MAESLRSEVDTAIAALGDLPPSARVRAALLRRMAQALDDAEEPAAALVKEFSRVLNELEPAEVPPSTQQGGSGGSGGGDDDGWAGLGAPVSSH